MRKHLFLIVFFVFGIALTATHAQNKFEFRFNKDKQFKIAQFTDIHWDNKSPNCAETTATINHVLETEKPDIAILTGDVVSDRPAKEGWMAIAKIFADAKMPWCALMGNHDAELGLSRREIFAMLEGLPYYMGEVGPTELTGSGNFVIPVLKSTDQTIAATLYCIDSNDYPVNPKDGHYDWIHADQINWFTQTSNQYTVRNGNNPLMSMAFFHIPLPEFSDIVGQETTIGIKKEGVASPDINSGFFSAMLEQRNMLGAFAGHDHDNDYIGIHHDIALGFGRTTGANAYGELERGARIILMYESQTKFDTWIRTKKGTEFKYYYPIGISENEELTMEYMPAKKNAKVKGKGLEYTYHEGGRLKKIADIDTNAKFVKSGRVDNFTLSPAVAQDSFAFVFKGLINVSERGVYRFYTNSDDGSILYLNGKVIVDNDGSHNARRIDSKVALEAGYHEIEVRYIENYMGELLEVGWASRNILEEKIPDNVLFITK